MIEIKDYGRMARQKRKEMGLSVQELAERTGLSKNTVSRFELGRNVTMENAKIILEALEIDDKPDEMFDDELEFHVNSLGRFSAAIRAKRIYLSWPVEMLANKSGVSLSTIYDIERGAKDARISTYLRIMSVLGIYVDFIDEDGYINYRISERGRR